MPYAIRDKDGNLSGYSKHPAENRKEYISETDDEVIQMLTDRENVVKIDEAIGQKVRAMAIQQLKADDKINADYPAPTVDDVKDIGAPGPGPGPTP